MLLALTPGPTLPCNRLTPMTGTVTTEHGKGS
jgi:hypothetical protein